MMTKPQNFIGRDILESVSEIHKYVCSRLDIKNPAVSALAMIYFRKTYNDAKPNMLLYKCFSTIHLASKVCEEQKHLARSLNVFQDILKSEKGIYIKCLKILGYNKNDDILDTNKANSSDFQRKLINCELELLSSLNFKLKYKLPYDYMDSYIKTILGWCLDINDVQYKYLLEDLKCCATVFSKAIHISDIFFTYDPRAIALATIDLSFGVLKIKPPDTGRFNWSTHVDSRIDFSYFDRCREGISDFFRYNKFSYNKHTYHESILNRWIKYPIEILQEEPMCPPPDFSLLEELAGTKNIVFRMWSDFVPQLPPPPIDYLIPQTKCSENKDIRDKSESSPIEPMYNSDIVSVTVNYLESNSLDSPSIRGFIHLNEKEEDQIDYEHTVRNLLNYNK